MSALHSSQAAFCAAMLSGAEDPLLPLLMEAEEVARRRLAAYRRSIIGNLSAALLSAYPVTARIVGLPFFREAARQFILAVPSRSGDLNEFGETFGDFLAGYAPAAELEYLPDVARLEWQVQQVYYAPDPPASDLSVLGRIQADRYAELRFFITPACARFDSRWPLDEIWRVNQAGYAGAMTVDFSRGAQVLILRRDGLVYVEVLTAAEAALLDVLADGASLGAATVRALAVDAGFDLGAALQRFVSQGLLCQARLAADVADLI